MTTIHTNDDQFRELAASTDERPVVMLNLLKFKKDGGRESYLRYASGTAPFLKEIGAKLLYFGRARELLYGTEDWDVVMLVQYPSRKAFLSMANNPDYLKVHRFREEALERAVLYATDPAEVEGLLK